MGVESKFLLATWFPIMRSKQYYNSKEPKSYSEIPIMAEDKIKVKVYFELKLLPKPVGLSVQCFNVIGLGCCNV